MPKTLRKVQKQIKSKKGSASSGGALHEKSRDAKRLRSALSRDEKIAKLAASKAKANAHQLQRVAFFKEHAFDKIEPLVADDVRRLIGLYIARSDGELAVLKRERRAGRPPSLKEVSLEARKNAEEKEYDTGFWLPDVLDAGNLKSLKTWDGNWISLNKINFIRFSRDGSQAVAKSCLQG